VAFQRALAIEPNFLPSQWGIAGLAYYRGDLNGTFDIFEQLGLRNSLRFTYYEAGRYERALELFDETEHTLIDPVDRRNHQRDRYRLLLRVGRAEEVLRWTDLLAEELATGGGAMDNPQLAGLSRWTVLELRASALVAMDSLAAGRAAALALMDAASEFGNRPRIQALQVNARIALKEGDAAAALAALEQIRQERANLGWLFAENREARAAAYRLSGRLEEAAAVHKELLEVFGGHAVSHYQLGLIYQEMGRPLDARQEFTKFLDMWSKADEGLPQLVDGRRRLAELTRTKP
jgi:tetratricopeptide (TPR) repeat protein